jgi:Carboxypeptidase regulatory-like domain
MRSLILYLLLFTPICAQDKPENKDAPKQRKGKITGKIMGDDGQPMDGAIVYVAPTSNSTDRGWQPIVVDDEGNFIADGLKVGSYSVDAISPGFVNPQSSIEVKYHHLGETVTISMVKGGVITGRVTNTSGEAVIAAPLHVTRIRDGEGRKIREASWFARSRKTDDQGNYRIYGLPAGKYLVSVGGENTWGASNGFKEFLTTYFPSSNRESATEINVNLGEETSAINIRHRSEKGRTVSGNVFGGNAESSSSISVILRTLPSFGSGGFDIVHTDDSSRSFSMHGIADGEYQIIAEQNESWGQNQKLAYRSAPRKITVKGGNISNIVLNLLPLSSVEGKIELAETSEKNRPECKSSRTSLPEEIVATLRRETIGKDLESDPDTWVSSDAPNDKGEVKYLNIEPARYRVTAAFPDETWYIKSVTMKSAAPKIAAAKTTTPATIDVGKFGLSLSSGEKIKDLLISITDGAANVKGRVITEPNKILPPRMRAYLVPAEKESAEDLLRYYEAKTKNGTFTFENLPPGKYLIIARPIPETEADEMPATPAAWDAAARMILRREAEAAGNLLELNSCQRVNDYNLKFSQAKK